MLEQIQLYSDLLQRVNRLILWMTLFVAYSPVIQVNQIELGLLVTSKKGMINKLENQSLESDYENLECYCNELNCYNVSTKTIEVAARTREKIYLR